MRGTLLFTYSFHYIRCGLAQGGFLRGMCATRLKDTSTRSRLSNPVGCGRRFGMKGTKRSVGASGVFLSIRWFETYFTAHKWFKLKHLDDIEGGVDVGIWPFLEIYLINCTLPGPELEFIDFCQVKTGPIDPTEVPPLVNGGLRNSTRFNLLLIYYRKLLNREKTVLFCTKGGTVPLFSFVDAISAWSPKPADVECTHG